MPRALSAHERGEHAIAEFDLLPNAEGGAPEDPLVQLARLTRAAAAMCEGKVVKHKQVARLISHTRPPGPLNNLRIRAQRSSLRLPVSDATHFRGPASPTPWRSSVARSRRANSSWYAGKSCMLRAKPGNATTIRP